MNLEISESYSVVASLGEFRYYYCYYYSPVFHFLVVIVVVVIPSCWT